MTNESSTDGTVKRVIATPAAEEFLGYLENKHGELVLHQSGGCCDGSAPMCYPKDEFMIGDEDVCLGVINGTGFYMSAPQFEYWKHTQLILDVAGGRGGIFSLDNGEGKRFVTHSHVFSEDELARLEEAI